MQLKINYPRELSKMGVILAVIIFWLNALDGILTLRLLSYKDFYELNPIFGFMLNRWGEAAIFPKLAIGIVVSLSIACWWTFREEIKTLEAKFIRTFIVIVIILWGIFNIYEIVLLFLFSR